MNHSTLSDLLGLLACPVCSGSLEPGSAAGPSQAGSDSDLAAGLALERLSALRCSRCGSLHPIESGIPRLLPEERRGPYHGYFARRGERDSLDAMDYRTPASFEQRRTWLTSALCPSSSGWILDVGCGNGRMLAPWARERAVLGVDASFSMLGWARRRGLIAIEGSAERLPIRDGVASAVVALEVAQYLPSPETFLAELTRVARPGARLCLSWLPPSFPRRWRRRILGRHEGSPRLHATEAMVRELERLSWRDLELRAGFWPGIGTHPARRSRMSSNAWASVLFVCATLDR